MQSKFHENLNFRQKYAFFENMKKNKKSRNKNNIQSGQFLQTVQANIFACLMTNLPKINKHHPPTEQSFQIRIFRRFRKYNWFLEMQFYSEVTCTPKV